MNTFRSASRSQGLTYVEVLVAVALLSIALLPALDALHTSTIAVRVAKATSDEHFNTLGKMEEVLAESFISLLGAAETAASESTPSDFSDPEGSVDRRLVFVALYDAENADGDGNVFTLVDPNEDGDGNIYSGYDGLLWVRVETEGSSMPLDSLVGP